jgi:hypothetical protein
MSISEDIIHELNNFLISDSFDIERFDYGSSVLNIVF